MAVYFNGKDQAAEYVGATLTRWEYNAHDDSDFYAVVWDAEAGECFQVEYGSTRYQSSGSVTVDATPEVVAAAECWLAGVLEQVQLAEAEADAARPEIGRRVRSLTTSGQACGAVGVMQHDIRNKHRPAHRYRNGRSDSRDPAMRRYGIRTDAGDLVWANGDCVEVLDPEPVDLEANRRRAVSRARLRRWRGAFDYGTSRRATVEAPLAGAR